MGELTAEIAFYRGMPYANYGLIPMHSNFQADGCTRHHGNTTVPNRVQQEPAQQQSFHTEHSLFEIGVDVHIGPSYTIHPSSPSGPASPSQ